MLLDAKFRFVRGSLSTTINAISVEPSGLDVVAEHRSQRVQHACAMIRMFDREHQLYSFVEISRHPIGAGQIELFVTAIEEVIDSRMFEKAIDDRYHFDIRAQIRHAWPERADPPNVESDSRALSCGVIQRFDDFLVDQGIHLRDDFCGLSV